MFRQFREIEPQEQFVVAADTSAGGGDFCAAQFLSVTHLDVPIVYHSKLLASEMTPALLLKLEEIFDKTGITPIAAIERNNGGVFEMERLARLNRDGKFIPYQIKTHGQLLSQETPKLGWDTNSATRPKMLADLKEMIDNRLVRIYDDETLKEMLAFVVVKTSSSWKAQAESGAHDDLVMSLAIAYQLYQTCPPTKSEERVYIPEVELLGGGGRVPGYYL